MEANESNRGEGSGDGALGDRVRRIEESLAFAEHAVEELAAEVADLSAEFTRLRLRFEALERLVRRPKGDSGELGEGPERLG